jgi:hypothetical protein
LVTLLPLLVTLRSATIFVHDSNEEIWSLVPNPFTAVAVSSGLPQGLANLTALDIYQERESNLILDGKLAIRLMLLPALLKVRFRTSDSEEYVRELRPEETDRVYAFLGTSTVRYLEIRYSSFSPAARSFLIRLPQKLHTLHLRADVHLHYPYSFLHLDGTFLQATLESLMSFPALRCLHFDIGSLLPHHPSALLVTALFPVLELLHVTSWENERSFAVEIIINALAVCSNLKHLCVRIDGGGDEAIQQECYRRDITYEAYHEVPSRPRY